MVSLGLEDKVVLVTGGNRGIGAAIVTLLEEQGAKVAYTHRSDNDSQHGALAIQADVTDSAAMEVVAEKVEHKLGSIYGIVANAGITRDNFFPKLAIADWDAVIDTNLKGVYNTLSPVIPKMYEQGEGSVVCISSISGERGNLGQTNYAASKAELDEEIKSNRHFQAMYSQAAQQTCHSVFESFKSFKALNKMFKQGKLAEKPQPPKYRKRGLNVVSYPKQALKLIEGKIRIPLGNKVKAWFGIDSFTIPIPSNLEFKNIRELRILPRNQCFYAEFVYKLETVGTNLNPKNVLGIDPGMDNWVTCISTVGTSFIVDGKHVKSLNRWYNKKVATIKEGRPQGFWSKKLAHLTEKRNRQMRDAVNKAARLVINHCLENNIGTVVFGWNQGQKQESNLGSKNNQKWVQVPTARLKNRISQLCEQYGIQFVETEESYTSKCSFVDGDYLPKYGEKPDDWKPSGKRVKRGLYRTALNWYVNADCNGSANILRKVATMLGLNLSGVGRVSLTAPQRIKLWSAKKKRSGVTLVRHVVSA